MPQVWPVKTWLADEFLLYGGRRSWCVMREGAGFATSDAQPTPGLQKASRSDRYRPSCPQELRVKWR